jgi:RecB family exonuclease
LSGKNEEKKQNVHIDYLSYSQIETFKICPLHFKLKYIYKIPTPPTSSQSFGNTFHKTLKNFYENVKVGKTPGKKLIFEQLEKNWINDGYLSKSHERKSYEKAKKFLVYFLDNFFEKNKTPIVMEQPFNIKLKGLSIGGKIDRVDEVENGIEIIDYKTGARALTQKQADEDLQLSIYALAAVRIPEYPFSRKPGEVKLSLMYFDEPSVITTTREKKDLELTEKILIEYKNLIEYSDFQCSKNNLCQNCEFKIFCSEN